MSMHPPGAPLIRPRVVIWIIACSIVSDSHREAVYGQAAMRIHAAPGSHLRQRAPQRAHLMPLPQRSLQPLQTTAEMHNMRSLHVHWHLGLEVQLED